jgi:hypothetical protein
VLTVTIAFPVGIFTGARCRVPGDDFCNHRTPLIYRHPFTICCYAVLFFCMRAPSLRLLCCMRLPSLPSPEASRRAGMRTQCQCLGRAWPS